MISTNNSNEVHSPGIPQCPLCQKPVIGSNKIVMTSFPDEKTETHCCAHPDCIWNKVKDVKPLNIDFEEKFETIGNSIVREVKSHGGKIDENGFHESGFSKTITLISEIFFPITVVICGIYNFVMFLAQLGKEKAKHSDLHMLIPVGKNNIDNAFITITNSTSTVGYISGKKMEVVAQN